MVRLLAAVRVLLVAVLASIALLGLGSFRADAQAVVDELDTGGSGARAAMSALWSSAPIVDVDPNEPGSSSAGLQEALARCNGGAGGCVLQLRANTTYTLPVHTTWSLPVGGTQPRAAFHTNGAADVWLRGYGDSSVISYTQAGNGPDRLIRNWMITADNGSDRVLFSDFRVVRADECTVDCRQYAMIFTMLGHVSDIVIDHVTVQGTQLVHDEPYPGRNIFMVFSVAYPQASAANTPRRVVVQNSRFSMSSSGIHALNCNDCRFVGNHFDAAGVPDDDNGATVRALGLFKGRNFLVAKNSINVALNGRTTTNWTGCILMQGDQTFDPTKPQSERINAGATVIGNACTGLRQSSAAGLWFQGYRNANVIGNHIYAGMCSNNNLVSCQSREDCGSSPTLSCEAAPAKAFYFEDMNWENANSNQGNLLRSNRFGNGTTCAVRMDSVGAVDPNSNTGNTFVGNTYRLGTIQSQGFCGSGSDQWFQNTITDNKLINATSQGGRGDRIDGAWILSDSRCDDPHQNALPINSTAILYLAGDYRRVEGKTSGFGTQRDFVEIEYDADLPNRSGADSRGGKLRQSKWSRLCVFIDDPVVDNGGRDTLVNGENDSICRLVENCSVSGSVTVGTREETPRGTAGATCSGTDLYSGLSSDQVASILAAFPKGNRCRVSLEIQQPGQKSSISVRLRQRSRNRTAP